MNLYQNMQKLLDANLKASLYRSIISKQQFESKIIVDGKTYTNLSSNDYLGLASNTNLFEEFLDVLPKDAIRQSSSGSPLLTGAHPSYGRLEKTFNTLFNKSAVFFTSGFATNSGIIHSLGAKENLIIADKLAHASIIDGMMSSGFKCMRYSHNDYSHLENIIEANISNYQNIIVVTEAVFSMDGDCCDIDKLVEIKRKYKNIYLYVDEAHSFTLKNNDGRGLCALHNKLDEIDFIVVTFGKGLGSQGAAVLCNEVSKNYFINTTRSLIFSTALSPFSFEYTNFMVNYMKEHNELRLRLDKISDFIHNCLLENNFENVSKSQIIPMLTYDNDKALAASEFFKEQGFYAMPIRHPTVPKGKARLRLSLSANLTDIEVEHLAKTIKDFSKK